jgi:hypothetical protein
MQIHLGCVSSIHLLGLFATVIRLLPDLISAWTPSSESAKRPLYGRAGHGRILDADTVTTATADVNIKSEETNVRR